jgi:hypothetical protein
MGSIIPLPVTSLIRIGIYFYHRINSSSFMHTDTEYVTGALLNLPTNIPQGEYYIIILSKIRQ